MSTRGAPWRGFDYVKGADVTMSRDDWQTIIQTSARQQRIAGDLTLFDERGRITHEIYDKEKTPSP